MKNLGRHLNTGSGIVGFGITLLSAAINSWPDKAKALAAPFGVSETLIEPRVSLTVGVISMAVLAASLVIWSRRDRVQEAVDRYRRNVPKKGCAAEGGRIIDMVATPPRTIAHNDDKPWQEQIEALAEAYGHDVVKFSAEVIRKRDALLADKMNDSTHLILNEPPWAERRGESDWRDPGLPCGRLEGFACDYSMIQALTDPAFVKDRSDVWRDIARVSGNSIFVSKRHRCLILHRRAAYAKNKRPMAFGRHLHMVGGNYEPEEDKRLSATACREADEEIDLRLTPENAPCLLMREDKTNWHMAVFLGVAVDDAYMDRLINGTLEYRRWEGDPEIVRFSRLEEILTKDYVVPTCYLAIVAWLLAGAPINTGGSAMLPWRAQMLGRKLAKTPQKNFLQGGVPEGVPTVNVA